VTSLMTDPRLEHSDTDGPIIAHFFCIVEYEQDIHRGLCGTPLRGVRATWKDQWCSVCCDVVAAHRRECPPCLAEWGSPDKQS
jgi:hypothetical protein